MNNPDTENYLRFLAEDWAQRRLETEQLVSSTANAIRYSSETAQSCADLLAEMHATMGVSAKPLLQMPVRLKPEQEMVQQFDQPTELPEA